MIIKRVGLKNIKAYGEKSFEFNPGVNFIRGRNGAGKSTIIEAIGYCVFDSRALDKADDMISYGADEGEIETLFECGGREYRAVRVLSRSAARRSWRIYEGDIPLPLSTSAEIRGALAEAMGVAKPLDKLFSRILGAYQGALRYPFDRSAGERKLYFNDIFGVDRYESLSSGLLLEAQKTLEHRAELNAKDLEIYEERAHGLDADEAGLIKLEDERKEARERLEAGERERGRVAGELEGFNALKDKKAAAERERAALLERVGQLEKRLIENSVRVGEAKEAANKAHGLKHSYENYLKLMGEAGEASERAGYLAGAEEGLRQCRARIADMEAGRQKTLLAAQEKLKEAGKAAKSAQKAAGEAQKKLAAAIAEEKRLEGEAGALRSERGELGIYIKKARAVQEFISNSLNAALEEVERATAASGAKSAKRELSLELERELAKGKCPIMGGDCPRAAGFSPGDQNAPAEEDDGLARANAKLSSLIGRMSGYDLGALSVEISKKFGGVLLRDAKEIDSAFKRFMGAASLSERSRLYREAYDAHKDFLARMDGRLLEALGGKSEEAAKARLEINTLKGDLSAFDTAAQSAAKDEEEAQKAIADAADTQLKINELMGRERKLSEDCEKLAGYREALDRLNADLEALRRPYEEYLSLKNAAEKLGALEGDALKDEERLKEAKAQLNRALAEIETISEALGRTQGDGLFDALTRLDRETGELRSRLANIDEKTGELKSRVEKKREAAALLAKAREEAGHLAGALRLIRELRQVFKACGPKVAGILRAAISDSAGAVYRGMARDGANLVFGGDYGLTLYDFYNGKARERSFRQLSGGEKMSAALSLRLSLLEAYSPIKLGFFDEPTDGLDVVRRENLALELKEQLTGLDQVFIISHDSAFDVITDSVVDVEV